MVLGSRGAVSASSGPKLRGLSSAVQSLAPMGSFAEFRAIGIIGVIDVIGCFGNVGTVTTGTIDK